jgi:hypothetical protein
MPNAFAWLRRGGFPVVGFAMRPILPL